MKKLTAPIAFVLLLAAIVFVSFKPATTVKHMAKKPPYSKLYAHLKWTSPSQYVQHFFVYLTSDTSWTSTPVTVDTTITYYAYMTITSGGGGVPTLVGITEDAGDTEGEFDGNLRNDPLMFTLTGAYTVASHENGVPVDCSDETPHKY